MPPKGNPAVFSAGFVKNQPPGDVALSAFDNHRIHGFFQSAMQPSAY